MNSRSKHFLETQVAIPTHNSRVVHATKASNICFIQENTPAPKLSYSIFLLEFPLQQLSQTYQSSSLLESPTSMYRKSWTAAPMQLEPSFHSSTGTALCLSVDACTVSAPCPPLWKQLLALTCLLFLHGRQI
uniref:Uncharacterized protein n=1 Tax=Arundo donax TaxID=35708 RepID=A0A0A8XQA5_ARUDO